MFVIEPRSTPIPVPGVAQVSINSHIAGHKAAQIWHFVNSPAAAWTQTNLQALVNAVASTYKTQFQSSFSPTVSIQNVIGVDLSGTVPLTAQDATGPWNSIGSGAVNPGLSLMVNFTIPTRYKGGHPRTYFPPFQNGALTTNEDQWIASATNLGVSGMQAIQTAVQTAVSGCSHAVIQWTYQVTVDSATGKVHRKRVGVKNVWNVIGYRSSVPVRTQRRRITSGA